MDADLMADPTNPNLPSLEVQRLVARLARMAIATIDLPADYPRGARMVGFLIVPDEHSYDDEGIAMMEALQSLADIDLEAVAVGIDERMNAPFSIPPRKPLEASECP